MANNIEYIYQILDRYSGPLKRITQATSRFKRQTNEAIKAAEKLGMQFERLPVNMRNFKRTIGSPVFQNQIRTLNQQTGHIARNIDHMGKASNRFAISSKALRAGRGAPGAASMAKQKATMGGMAGGFGVMAGMTLPVIGAGAAAVKTAIDFQSAFIGVQKTVDATAPQLARMRREFEKMSTEIPVSAVELMGIGEAAGQLGIQTENVTSFSRTMALLGATTNMAGQEGAVQLARLANITQMSQRDFDRLGSTIVALGNNLATSEAEITSMALRLAPAGHAVKMSEAQILALAGSLSSIGIEAEAGGTAFSKVMYGINNAVSQGGDMLKKFAVVSGMSSAQLAESFKKDAGAGILAFLNGLQRMQKEGKNVNLILEALEFSDVRMKQALIGAAGAGDLFNRSMGIGSTAWKENTALAYEAQLRFRGWSSQLIMARNKLMLLANTFGKIITPIWIKFVDVVVALLGLFDKLPKSVKIIIVIVTGLATAAAATAAAVGLMTIAFQAAIPVLMAIKLWAMQALAPIAAYVMSITWPVWLAVVALGMLAIILKKAWDNSAMLRESFKHLGEALSPAIDSFKQIFNMLGSSAAQKPLDDTANAFTAIGDALSIAVDMLAAFIASTTQLSQTAGKLIGALSMGEFKDAWNILTTGKSKYDIGTGAAMDKAKARSQDTKVELSGQIGVSATGGARVDRAEIGLNTGYNLAVAK